MFLLHYIIPLVIFYFYRNKLMLWGLLLGNAIDLDHIYYRIIGKVPWFGSACTSLSDSCSNGVYPLHGWIMLIFYLAIASLVFVKNKKIKFIGWIALGAAMNVALDYLGAFSGIVF